MTDIKTGDKVTITATVDAVMTGLNSGPRARVILSSGEKIWLDLNLNKLDKAILYGKREEKFLRDNNEKKYKCYLSLGAEGVTSGTMMLTKEEYEIVKRVTDESKWDDLEWEDWCGSFSIHMEGEEE